jgi:hypothetical protein
MNLDQITHNLNKIIELSSSMLTVARTGDWEKVQGIEQRRKELFDQTFPLDRDTITDPAAVTKQIQQIADLDKETMALMEDSRKELSGLANKISSGRHAVGAYKDVAGR